MWLCRIILPEVTTEAETSTSHLLKYVFAIVSFVANTTAFAFIHLWKGWPVAQPVVFVVREQRQAAV